MYEVMYIQIDTKQYLKTGSIEVIGEPVNADTIVGNTGKAPKSGFDILRAEPFCDMLKKSGIPFCKVLALFVGGRDSENCVDLSFQQISAETKLSRNTIRSAIRSMEDSAFVVHGLKKIMINPYTLHRGDSNRESYLSSKYNKLAKEYKKGDYAKNSEEEESSGNER